MSALRILLASLLALALHPGAAAAAGAIFDDHKVGPPAGCLQNSLGLGLSKEEVPQTLEAAQKTLRADWIGEKEASVLVARALKVESTAGPDGRARLQEGWSAYAAALSASSRARGRSCVGGVLAERSVVDLLYVVLAPVWMFSHGPDQNINPARLFIPVAGAVGLASDPVYLVVSPLVRWRLSRRARAVDAAREAFAGLVAGMEQAAR